MADQLQNDYSLPVSLTGFQLMLILNRFPEIWHATDRNWYWVMQFMKSMAGSLTDSWLMFTPDELKTLFRTAPSPNEGDVDRYFLDGIVDWPEGRRFIIYIVDGFVSVLFSCRLTNIMRNHSRIE